MILDDIRELAKLAGFPRELDDKTLAEVKVKLADAFMAEEMDRADRPEEVAK